MNIKQKVIGSILEHTSNLLNHQCCQVSENANNEIYQKSSENEENKLVVEITPTLLIGSKMINVDKDQDEVIDKKTPRKDIAITGDYMIKYMNGQEISRSSSL